MTTEELVAAHPRLYHLTTPGAWEAIKRHGLLSTESLLRRIGVLEADVQERIARRRPQREVLETTPLGRVVLNDNIPLHEGKLASALDDGLTVADWLRALNQRVFFWVREPVMTRLAKARVNRTDPRELLVFCTRSLVAANGSRMEVAPFNTGSTLYDPARRGLSTFTPVGAMAYAVWRQKRMPPNKSPDRVVEVVVRDGVADVESHLIERRVVGA